MPLFEENLQLGDFVDIISYIYIYIYIYKFQPCFLGKPLKAQEKLKELEIVFKCNIYLYFLV